jgi:serine/threonine protein kinase
MMPKEVDSIFNAALELDPPKREAFIDEACAGDESLRKEVVSLLEAHFDADRFLERSAMEAANRFAEDPMVGMDVSHYHILQELSRGGMGVVYKAEDTRLKRNVALKFLSEELASDSQALERFQREACAASALNHPHICTIHDIGEFEGRAFIVMELLEGTTLKERIGSRPLPVSEVLDFGRQVAEGLDAAHSKGIIHRDIKPSNIFVTDRGQIRIIDFGLAKLTQKSPETQQDGSHTLPPGAGTVSYMSPEQALGEELDARTDIWSLGVTLYEMATGTLPFTGKTQAATYNRILSAELVAPSNLNPELPRKLDRIIAGMVKKNREDRPPVARQVAAELACVDRELVCLLDLSSPILNKDLVHVLNTWVDTHSMQIRYVLLPGPKRHKVRVLEDFAGEAPEEMDKQDAEWVQDLGIPSASILRWDEICARVDFKAAYKKVLEAYRDNVSFKELCLSQTESDLQPRFDALGVQNQWDARVWVNRWVRYLLEELALKVALFESGEFHGEILPQAEKDIVRRIYEGAYFPCWVGNRGFEVISLTRSRISHANYIHENEAGMLGFALQFYTAQEPQ